MKIEQTFLFHDKEVTLNISYQPNPGMEASGFNILKLPFPQDFCVGYPMLEATVDAHNLNGYEKLCGFIQILHFEITQNDGTENDFFCRDVTEEMRSADLPYFAVGYPAALFDAPCHNLQAGQKHLRWTAYTALVEMPVAHINNNETRFLSGFSWGYEEGLSGFEKILPLKTISKDDFQNIAKTVNINIF